LPRGASQFDVLHSPNRVGIAMRPKCLSVLFSISNTPDGAESNTEREPIRKNPANSALLHDGTVTALGDGEGQFDLRCKRPRHGSFQSEHARLRHLAHSTP
jgi:hypothetical protein